MDKQNPGRLRPVASEVAQLAGIDDSTSYAVEVSKPGNLGKQMEQSKRARAAEFAIAILDDNESQAADYDSSAEALIESADTALRAIAVVARSETGAWRVEKVHSAFGYQPAKQLSESLGQVPMVLLGRKPIPPPGRRSSGNGHPVTLERTLLDPRLRDQLLRVHAEMTSAGELRSEAELDVIYRRFRERFGPERLQELEGEELLERMHGDSTQQSLVYWLEFKNDDEFPAIFGSISGGSAFKFGVYKRREGGWAVEGDDRSSKEISARDAIRIAEQHRSQLLQAVELLGKVRPDTTAEDYADLDVSLTEIAPDVAATAWGHKYFHLLFPTKLDDFHVVEYQNYHLLRLLQPEAATAGRYASAWRYVAIARELGISLKHLTSILHRRNGRPRRYWRIGTSDGRTPRIGWPQMHDGEVAAIGWRTIGDLRSLVGEKTARDTLKALLAEHYPNAPNVMSRKAGEIAAFLSQIVEGDIVCCADGVTVLGIGRVTGQYTHDPKSDFPHRRSVRWLHVGDWILKSGEGNQTTVWRFKDYESLLEVERTLLEAPDSSPKPLPSKAPRKRDFSGVQRRIVDVLDRKGQVILYGPPGTGKTYWAASTARDLVSSALYGRLYSELARSEQLVVEGGPGGASGLVRTCTFHPEYGYEGFIEGYHPVNVDGRLVYERRDGVFKRLCNDARADSAQRPHVLVIDEINRGDIPRIFGELLTLLERDKRGKSVSLPLSGDPFSVPGNVFVIATMNTADRSIALLDVALRRRFGFVSLMPDYATLGAVTISGLALSPWLRWVNEQIRSLVGGDGRHREIGHAYLWSGEGVVTDPAIFSAILRDDIVPLLEEYCFEDLSALEKILGNVIVDVDAQRVRYEIFDGDVTSVVAALRNAAPHLKIAEEDAVDGGDATETAPE